MGYLGKIFPMDTKIAQYGQVFCDKRMYLLAIQSGLMPFVMIILELGYLQNSMLWKFIAQW